MKNVTKISKTAKTETIRSVIREAKSSIVSVVFTKKDGTLRTMSFNARYKEGIKGLNASEKAQKAVKTRANNNPNLIRAIDLDAKRKTKNAAASWRSFDCESVVSIKSGGKVIEFEG